MSTALTNTNGEPLRIPELDKKAIGKFYVVTAEWNPGITTPLRKGAVEVLNKAGVAERNICEISVPGTVELVNAAALIARGGEAEAVIIIGCVIRGDTPHFDYVCQIAAQGVAQINAEGHTPVIFGVLTVENLAQAQERAGGKLGNKGEEAAAAAISMVNLHKRFRR